MTERTFFGGSQQRRAVHAPQTKQFDFLVCRVFAAKPTLVVKTSDTSLLGKAGSNPAFEVTHRGAASRGSRTRHGSRSSLVEDRELNH